MSVGVGEAERACGVGISLGGGGVSAGVETFTPKSTSVDSIMMIDLFTSFSISEFGPRGAKSGTCGLTAPPLAVSAAGDPRATRVRPLPPPDNATRLLCKVSDPSTPGGGGAEWADPKDFSSHGCPTPTLGGWVGVWMPARPPWAPKEARQGGGESASVGPPDSRRGEGDSPTLTLCGWVGGWVMGGWVSARPAPGACRAARLRRPRPPSPAPRSPATARHRPPRSGAVRLVPPPRSPARGGAPTPGGGRVQPPNLLAWEGGGRRAALRVVTCGGAACASPLPSLSRKCPPQARVLEQVNRGEKNTQQLNAITGGTTWDRTCRHMGQNRWQ